MVDAPVIAPRITGSLSALSSSILIYLIMRSDTKFSTIYHRIMFGSCIGDIIYSLAIALTTLPMPRDLSPYNFGSDFWQGIRLGNQQTCTAQGFFYWFGVTMMFSYSASLCTYYACVLFFKMKEENIVKYVERFLLRPGPIILALGISVPPLFTRDYGPSQQEAWCTSTKSWFDIYVMVSVSFFLVYIFICFGLIVGKVVLKERRMIYISTTSCRRFSMRRFGRYSSSSAKSEQGDIQILNKVIETVEYSKVIIIQASAYIFSFLLTLSTPIIRAVITDEPTWLIVLHHALMPLQGVFNLVIFITHKVYNYRRKHPNVSQYHIIRKLFTGKADENAFVQRISALSFNDDQSVMEIEIENERVVVSLPEILSEDLSPFGASSHHEVSSGNKSQEELSNNRSQDLEGLYLEEISEKSRLESSRGSTSPFGKGVE